MIDLSEFKEAGIEIEKREKVDDESEAFSRINDGTIGAWIKFWTRNAAENFSIVPRMPKCFTFLKNIQWGKEAAILASGPSLDDSIQWIKNFKGIVFAGNSTINPCVANGRWPDWVVILDADEYVPNQFEWFSEEEKQKFKVILPTYIHPSVPKIFNPELIWWFNPYNPAHWFFKNCLHYLFPGIGGLFSSSCNPGAMIRLAHWMGIRKIYLLGTDFGFPEGRERCSVYDREGSGWVRTAHDDFCNDKSERSIINGIETTIKLRFSHSSITSIIKALPEMVTIDCSNGIMTEFPKMNFKEVVYQLPSAKANGLQFQEKEIVENESGLR